MDAEQKSTPDFVEISLTVPFEIHDAVANYIIENFAGGGIVLDEDSNTPVKISFYIAEENVDSVRNKLAGYINDIAPEEAVQPDNIHTKLILSRDWEEKYRQNITPVRIHNVVIRPPWHEIDADNDIEIIIEPKLAFGTGHHETTRLCIKEIIKHFKPGQTFFDLGCGSGILSILAAKMGAERVVGVDIEPEAVKNAIENIEINNVSNIARIRLGSIEKSLGEEYDFLAANILKSTIVGLYRRILHAVRPGGIVLLSGLQKNDKQEIDVMLDRFGYLKYSINSDDQWIAVTVVKE